MLRVYFSMTRRRANCASLVIASHSSRMTSLNPVLKIRRVEAKSWISCRTTLMPRSSEALSSRTMLAIWKRGRVAPSQVGDRLCKRREMAVPGSHTAALRRRGSWTSSQYPAVRRRGGGAAGPRSGGA